MKEDIKSHVENVDFWLKQVSSANDNVVKTTEDLRMILLNLKIVSAYLPKTVGIEPVIDELERIISSLHDTISEMVTQGRKELRGSWLEVKSEVENHG